MRALTYHGPRAVAHETVPDPAIVAPGDVVVRVELSAVCGSDLHVYNGRETGLDEGTVLGHEFVGRVAEVGRDVRSLGPGDRVVSPFTTSCGRCFYCERGLTARCTAGQLFGWVAGGAGLQGAQAEYVRVPLADTTLLAVPEDLPLESALLLGDVLPTGYQCALRGGIEPGSVCAVLGCGPVGLMAVVGALERGAGTVLAFDALPERLALAARFGAVPCDYRDDPLAAVRERTEGRGADSVLEAVGSAEAHRLALQLVRPGGTISVVGVHHEPQLPFGPAQAYDLNLTYCVGRCPARHLMPRLLPLLRHATRDLAAVVSHRMPLERGPEAYAMFDARRDGCTKVVLEPRS